MRQGNLGRHLRVLRAERGLSLTEAAEWIGVTRDTLSEIERGKRHPYTPTLAKIARGYGVPVEELLEEPAASDPEAGPPRVERDDLAKHGIQANATEAEMLNRLLAAYFELAQTGAQKATIAVPDLGGPETGVDMARVHMLVEYAIAAGILTPDDLEALKKGVRSKLVAG
jgi:transcriptional regulator with XRE-family HTH domain